MYCPKCGRKAKDGSMFCGGCGEKFEEAEFAANTSKKIEFAGVRINVDELKEETGRALGSAREGLERFAKSTQEAATSINNKVNNMHVRQSGRISENQGTGSNNYQTGKDIPATFRRIGKGGLALLVVAVIVVLVSIGINRISNDRKSESLSDLLNKTGLVECRYDNCNEEIFKEGYCQKHYFLTQGSDIVTDVLNGEISCKYSDCTDTAVYKDGYCQKHYAITQGTDMLEDVLNGEVSCKYSGCSDTEIYQDGYCRLHYAEIQVSNSIFGNAFGGDSTTKCKYSGCNETYIYKDGYCVDHYKQVSGSLAYGSPYGYAIP